MLLYNEKAEGPKVYMQDPTVLSDNHYMHLWVRYDTPSQEPQKSSTFEQLWILTAPTDFETGVQALHLEKKA